MRNRILSATVVADATSSLFLRESGSNWSISRFVLNLKVRHRLLFSRLAPKGQAVSTVSIPRTCDVRVALGI